MQAEFTHVRAELLESTSVAQRIDLVLIGTRGKVGSAFRRQLFEQQLRLQAEANIDLRLLASFDRRGFAFDVHGLAPASMDAHMKARQSGDVEQLLDHVARRGATRTLVVDCTASEEVADLYPRLLASGMGIVAANKRANARKLSIYNELQRMARLHGVPYRYETTVGSAIPLLGPLRDLRLRGERVIAVQGVLSGSLSYILQRMHEGCALSAAVAEAMDLGFTEPDPMEDLLAIDLSRKLLVLAREAGFAIELEDVIIEPFIDRDLRAGDDLIGSLQTADAAWQEKIRSAQLRDECWVAIAEVNCDGGRISVCCVPAQSAFAQLKPGQNLISIRTELQDQMPLSVSGPGAGVEITAAGVLSDVLTAATCWSR